MNQDRLAILLQRSIAEIITEQERDEMMLLLNNPVDEHKVKDLLFETYKSSKSIMPIAEEKGNQILEAIFRSDCASVEKGKVYTMSGLRWSAAAAVILAMLSVGFYFFRANEYGYRQKTVKNSDDRLPGGNQATLTLSDGSVVPIAGASTGTLARQAGLIITKTADGELVYRADNEHVNDSNLGYNTIATPFGGKYEVLLQDGTKIILNAGSSITYPISFKKGSRRVVLKGEAYFEVAKDPSQPFVVATVGANGILGQEIQVLGTHFNVCAYPDEGAYVTTLLEGSIRISTGHQTKTLVPGDQALVKQNIQLSNGEVYASVAWKNDVFYFIDQPIENVMRTLRRWYNVEIIYQGAIPKIGFWAQISRQKKLSEVLDVLEQTNGVHFKIEGRRVIVMQ
jgi:transmembrane sensor